MDVNVNKLIVSLLRFLDSLVSVDHESLPEPQNAVSGRLPIASGGHHRRYRCETPPLPDVVTGDRQLTLNRHYRHIGAALSDIAHALERVHTRQLGFTAKR